MNVELNTEMVTYEQDDTGVAVTLSVDGRSTEPVRAKFLLGTDGGKSTLRYL